MSDSYYDVAQICRNGHVTNSRTRDHPQHNQDHCARCGAPTIMKCQSCSTPIRGEYHIPGVLAWSEAYTVPAYCHKCGDPFPWTWAAVAAASGLADELEGLSADEREALKRTLDDLVRDTPATPVAETRFKKIMKKAGKDGYDAMRSILTDVVSETVRKTVFGPPSS